MAGHGVLRISTGSVRSARYPPARDRGLWHRWQGVGSLEDFWVVMGEAVSGPGGYFGRNLDAFNDCLRGGFGAPEDDDYIIEWRHHEQSRAALGYPETVSQLELRLARCHPSNRPTVRAELEAARAGLGPTVSDWLAGIFEEQVPGRLRLG